MTRQLLALIVSTLTLAPCVMKAEEPTPKKAARPESNQVYVKIIMPTDPADREKDRPVVESWIAEDLKQRGQAKFTAVTRWVSLDLSPFEATAVWDGNLGDNALAILRDFRKHGDAVWSRFTGGKDRKLRYYRALVTAFRLGGDSELTDELDKVVTEIVQITSSP